MKSRQPTLFLVWQFDTVLLDTSNSTNFSSCQKEQIATLRAADTTIEQARGHRDFLEERFIPFPDNPKEGDRHFSEGKTWEYNAYQETWNRVEFPFGGERFFRIESISANHLFGEKLLGTLERINKRRKL